MLNVKRLRVLRVEMGISQYVAADLAGLPRHRFQLIEQGLVTPDEAETQALVTLERKLSASIDSPYGEGADRD